jgi:hypothetical protein
LNFKWEKIETRDAIRKKTKRKSLLKTLRQLSQLKSRKARRRSLLLKTSNQRKKKKKRIWKPSKTEKNARNYSGKKMRTRRYKKPLRE